MKIKTLWGLSLLFCYLFSSFAYGEEEKAVKIKASWQSTCALTNQHRLYCWGGRNYEDFLKGIKVKNFDLGAKGIFINDKTELGTDEISVKREELESFIALENNDWEEIYNFLKTL